MNSSNKLELKVENPKFIFLEKIKEMFLTIIEKEKAINDIKISLSKSSSSNIMTYFNEIDTNIKGYIDLIDLKNISINILYLLKSTQSVGLSTNMTNIKNLA